MSFKSNFERICIEKNVSPSFVCAKIGISTSNYSQWTEESVPRKTTLIKIADVLDVSVDYLLDKEKKLPGVDEELAQDVSRFIQLSQGMSQEQKENLFRLMESMQEK